MMNIYQAMAVAIAYSMQSEMTYFVTWEGEEIGFLATCSPEQGDCIVYDTEDGRAPLTIETLLFTKELDQLNKMMGKSPNDVYEVVCWLRDICTCKEQVNLELNEELEWSEFKEKAEQWKLMAALLQECAEKIKRKKKPIPLTTFKSGDTVKPKNYSPDIDCGIVNAAWIGSPGIDEKRFLNKEIVSVSWAQAGVTLWLAEDLVLLHRPSFATDELYYIKNDPDPNKTIWEFNSWRDDGLPLMNLCNCKSHIRCFKVDQLIPCGKKHS